MMVSLALAGLLTDFNDCAPKIASTGPVIFGTIRGNKPYLFERLKPFRRDDPMNILPVDRVLSIYGSPCGPSRDKRGSRTAFQASNEIFIDGEKMNIA